MASNVCSFTKSGWDLFCLIALSGDHIKIILHFFLNRTPDTYA